MSIFTKWFKKKPCEHDKNVYINEYKHNPTGTPMVHKHCYDCGYDDRGHVYANADTYPESRITEIRAGLKTVS